MVKHIDASSTTLLTNHSVYPESPRWRDGLLWFSDVHDYAIKTVNADGKVAVVTQVPGRPAGLGFLPDGRLLVASALDQLLSVWDGQQLTALVDLSSVSLGLLNDMVVDGQGRAFVGDTGYNLMAGETARPGQIISVEIGPDDAPRVRVVANDVMFPNGAAINSDGTTLWLAESTADQVSRFAVGADGSLTRTFSYSVPDFPDGLCLDVDDGIWVALLKRGEFHHLRPDGSTDQILQARGQLAVACTLGGPDRQTLYACSADTTMAELAKGISTGLVSEFSVNTPGAGFP